MTTPTTGAPRGVPTDADIQQVLADSVGDKIWQAPWLIFARAILAAFSPPALSGWQPIETSPRDRQVLFWIVSKPPEECPVDSSGNVIAGSHLPYRALCKYGTWGSLSTATAWQDVPNEPKEQP